MTDAPDAKLEFRHQSGAGRLLVRVAQTVGGCPAALFVLMTQPTGHAPLYVRVAQAADLNLPVGPLPAGTAAKTLYRSNEATVLLGPADDVVTVAGLIRARVAAICRRAAKPGPEDAWTFWAGGRDA